VASRRPKRSICTVSASGCDTLPRIRIAAAMHAKHGRCIRRIAAPCQRDKLRRLDARAVGRYSQEGTGHLGCGEARVGTSGLLWNGSVVESTQSGVVARLGTRFINNNNACFYCDDVPRPSRYYTVHRASTSGEERRQGWSRPYSRLIDTVLPVPRQPPPVCCVVQYKTLMLNTVRLYQYQYKAPNQPTKAFKARRPGDRKQTVPQLPAWASN
jgi:hypothetical protein